MPQYSILRKSLPPEILAPERVSFFFTQSSSLKSEPIIETLPLVANPEIKNVAASILSGLTVIFPGFKNLTPLTIILELFSKVYLNLVNLLFQSLSPSENHHQ